MTALSDRARPVERLALVATLGDDGKSVLHVGLTAEAAELTADTLVQVFHSGPPVEAAQADASGNPIIGIMNGPRLVANLGLTPEQREGVERNLETVRTLVPHRRLGEDDPFELTYVALPHEKEPGSGGADDVPYARYSCAGFVLRCLRDVFDHELVDTSCLPTVSLAELLPFWPAAHSSRVRTKVGLINPEPWAVLLPGYLFHACDPLGRRAHVAVLAERFYPADPPLGFSIMRYSRHVRVGVMSVLHEVDSFITGERNQRSRL